MAFRGKPSFLHGKKHTVPNYYEKDNKYLKGKHLWRAKKFRELLKT